MDDMFEARIRAAGGKRIANTTSFPLKATTFLRVSSPIMLDGELVNNKLFNAFIDDKSYNCHAYTLFDAKKTKMSKLKKVAKKIPAGPKKGENYYDSVDLLSNNIHFETLNIWMGIYPRWIAKISELNSHLNSYRKRKAGEKLVAGSSIIMYELKGQYPHSSKVIKINSKGDAIMARGKFGHYSLFEHHPLSIPPHYGNPVYFMKK